MCWGTLAMFWGTLAMCGVMIWAITETLQGYRYVMGYPGYVLGHLDYVRSDDLGPNWKPCWGMVMCWGTLAMCWNTLAMFGVMIWALTEFLLGYPGYLMGHPDCMLGYPGYVRI